MAVCADVYVKEEDNFFYGKAYGKAKDASKPDKLDNRKTVTKAYIVFLTEHLTDEMKPSYVNTKQSYSWGTADFPSSLFKLVKGWYPTATDEQIRDMDLNNLVGKHAWVTVIQKVVGDKAYSSVSSASNPPPGAPRVSIPADFKRHDEKVQVGYAAPAPPPTTAPPNPNPVKPLANPGPIAGYPQPSTPMPADQDLPF